MKYVPSSALLLFACLNLPAMGAEEGVLRLKKGDVVGGAVEVFDEAPPPHPPLPARG